MHLFIVDGVGSVVADIQQDELFRSSLEQLVSPMVQGLNSEARGIGVESRCHAGLELFTTYFIIVLKGNRGNTIYRPGKIGVKWLLGVCKEPSAYRVDFNLLLGPRRGSGRMS